MHYAMDGTELEQGAGPVRRGPALLPGALTGLSLADQYEKHKKLWQRLTQQWRAEVTSSLIEVRAIIERQTEASTETPTPRLTGAPATSWTIGTSRGVICARHP